MACVLVTEKINPAGPDLLAESGHEVLDGWAMDEAALQRRLPDIEGILVRTAPIPAEMIRAMPALQVISKHGVGCDNIAVAEARKAGIAVAIAADANADSVVEHTIMFMLNMARDPVLLDSMTRGDYAALRPTIKAIDIGPRTILIIGHGRIGSRLARVCKAFGMTVLIHDIKYPPDQKEVEGFRLCHDLDEALGLADFLSLHIPLTDTTKGMIGLERLRRMRPGSFVINCARGGIIDEAAACQALEENHLGGLACDVFSVEPISPDNPLLHAPRCMLSPHAAAFTDASLVRMSRQAGQNIHDHFNGGISPHCLYTLEALSG